MPWVPQIYLVDSVSDYRPGSVLEYFDTHSQLELVEGTARQSILYALLDAYRS